MPRAAKVGEWLVSTDADRAEVLHAVRRQDKAGGGLYVWEVANRTHLTIERAADACHDLIEQRLIRTLKSRGGVLYAPRTNREAQNQWLEDRSVGGGEG